MTARHRVAKRSLDVVLASAGLVLMSPLMVVIAAAVKLDSKGPVLFGHRRVGRNFEPITVWKFRTMRHRNDGAEITTSSDDRITRLGRILRRAKLDELPQLFNVVVGDMSLVGPRPEVEMYVERHRDEYARLLSVRPGLTDPASLAFRNEEEILGEADDPVAVYEDVVLPEKIRLSGRYVDEASLLGDVRLIAKTVGSVVRGDDAVDSRGYGDLSSAFGGQNSRVSAAPSGSADPRPPLDDAAAQYRWVFLIGAARSGTKFLRDTLSTSKDIACIPYDVGYVWREGQHSSPHDELPPGSATPRRVKAIRNTLARLAKKNGAQPGQIVIEKTVGNALRVDFVRKCFPEARFIYLEREPLDVIASAYGQWVAPVDRSYLLEKLRFFPFRSWRYGLWFAKNQILPRTNEALWGPRYDGIQADLESKGTLQAVVEQCRRSVRRARLGLSDEDAYWIAYEDLAPKSDKWADLLDWLEVPDAHRVTQRLSETFSAGNGWPGQLSEPQQADAHASWGPGIGDHHGLARDRADL